MKLFIICSKHFYSKIEEIASENGFDFICDGNNISDLVIDRPGILITYEKNFKARPPGVVSGLKAVS